MNSRIRNGAAQGLGGAQKVWRSCGVFGAGAVLILVLAGEAYGAAPTVTIQTGPFTDGQIIVVSGSGFPPPSQDPSGLQIIECSDPQGSAANLPTDATSGCEGITVNPSQINTDRTGAFRTSYRIASLSTSAGTSSIDCSATQVCVLWVGTDYNNAFTSGAHAFSKPFVVTGAPASAPITATTSTTTAPSSAASGPSTVASVPAVGVAANAQGSLAVTGVTGLVTWLLGLGLPMALLGILGRRVSSRRAH